MKKIKRFALLLCVLSCVISFTACAQQKDEGVSYSYSEADIITSVANDIEAVAELTDEDIENLIQSYQSFESKKFLVNSMKSWQVAKKEAGNIIDIVRDELNLIDYTFETKDEEIFVEVRLECEKRDVIARYTFGIVDDTIGVKEITYEAQFTLKEKLTSAASNTLIGLASVFLVLLFLSFVIFLFKYIAKAQNKMEEKKAAKEKILENEPDTFSQIIEKEEAEGLADDSELVAVITAAIAAMEQTTTDGFVVRSIRKVPNSKWKRV
jgi:sodium pump decarboxylase gamma subunit